MLQYHFNWKTISVAAGMTWWNFYFQIFEKAIGAMETVEFLLHGKCDANTPCKTWAPVRLDVELRLRNRLRGE